MLSNLANAHQRHQTAVHFRIQILKKPDIRVNIKLDDTKNRYTADKKLIFALYNDLLSLPFAIPTVYSDQLRSERALDTKIHREGIMSEEQVTANVPEKGNIYRRAKLWQIICYSFSAFPLMGAYILIGYASYSASIG